MKKIKNLKKAFGDFKKYNKGGCYDSHYGILYFNKETMELWCDEFVNYGNCSYTNYADINIINLSYLMHLNDIDITMENVINFIEKM